MNNNEFSNIKVSKDIDKAIDKGVERALREIKNIKGKKRKKIIATTAACFVLLFTFMAMNPAIASKIPMVSNVFQAIEKSLHFPGDYSKYATSINETISDNGIKVTMSDILCDGEGLYVTYKVESEKPFKYTSWGDKSLDMNQLMTTEAYNKVSFSNEELDNSGLVGLEGKFLDENTFVGMERYYLKSLEIDIPDEFDFEVKLNSIGTGAIKAEDKDQYFNGEWAFKVPVKLDKSISKEIAINYKKDNGFSLDSIMITPVSLIVYNKKPDNDSTNYPIKVFADGKQLDFDMSKPVNDNMQINYFGALPKDCRNLRVILYKDILKEIKTIEHPNGGGVETTYEDIGDEILLDKTVKLN